VIRRKTRTLAGSLLLVAVVWSVACTSEWEVEHRVEIAAPQETIWQLLTDLERYADWNVYSPHVEGILAVGEIVTVEAHLGDEVRSVENRVTVVDPPHTLCWQSQEWYGWLVRGTRCRHLEPLPDGRIQLRHHELMSGPLAGPIEWLYRTRIEEGLKLLDDALKHAAEAAADPA
jgi:hypothetical protein